VRAGRILVHHVGIDVECEAAPSQRPGIPPRPVEAVECGAVVAEAAALEAGREPGIEAADGRQPEPHQAPAAAVAAERRARLAEAVRRRASAPTLLESSGGLALANARAYAETGVEFLAVGALTHSVTALDVGLDLQET